MIQALLFLLISAVLTFALYPFLITFLYRFQLREEINPEAPGTHQAKRGTPTAAGVLMLVVFVVLNLAFNRSAFVTPVVLVAVALGGFGLLEDFFKIYYRSRLRRIIRGQVITPVVTLSDLSWNLYKLVLFPWNAFKEISRALGTTYVGGIATYQKILFQVAVAACLAVWLGLNLGTELWLPTGVSIDLGVFYIPSVVVAFLFFVNSINVTDGLDGLAGGLLMIGFTALMAIAAILGNESLAITSAVLVGTLLAFLYFNIYPARVFMGNVGALFLAGAFVSTTFVLGREVLLPVLGGVFAAEGLSVLIQVGSVKLGRGRVFLMAPIHHHFEVKGWPETKVTMRFWLAGVLLAFLGLYLAFL